MNEDFDIPESFFLPSAEPALPAPIPAGVAKASEPWPSRLPFDVALGVEDSDEICLRHDIDPDTLIALLAHPLFQKQVDQHKQDILANGLSFKTKARIQAETYLSELDDIIADKTIGAGLRLQAIQSVVKYAGLEPKNGDGNGNTGGTTRLVFQWQDGTGQVAVEVKNGDAEGNNS